MHETTKVKINQNQTQKAIDEIEFYEFCYEKCEGMEEESWALVSLIYYAGSLLMKYLEIIYFFEMKKMKITHIHKIYMSILYLNSFKFRNHHII